MAIDKRKKLLGQKLVEEGLITPKQLEIALEEQVKLRKSNRELLGEVIIKMGFLDETTMAKFLEKHTNVPYVNVRYKDAIDPDVVRMIPEGMARNFKVLALKIDKDTGKLIVAMSNPFDIVAIDTLKLKTGYDLDIRSSYSKDIEEVIDKVYTENDAHKAVQDFIDIKAVEREVQSAKDAKRAESELELEAIKTPVIEFVDSLMKDAIRKRASDIHVEPHEDKLCIRYRIDGFLQEIPSSPKEMQSAIITRLKLLGSMDIAEQRLPQDGRFKFTFKGKDIDIRMASSPSVFGEKIVLRILDSSTLLLRMEELGMTTGNVETFKTILQQPYGMILVTGPTGSGKTTSLYSALGYLNKPEKNIVTIEDPVEYQIVGINQIQTKHQIGLTFASGLRTVLRQDPDIIMIGEIRDLETLENAIKASMTGHLVLSTIHTNDAPGAIFRLVYMGLQPYLISSCLSLVIAQRLIRKICENCKQKMPISPRALAELEKKADMPLKGFTFYQGKGCDRCGGTGYGGRIGLYEFLVVSPRIKRLILDNVSEEILKKAAREEGMKTIYQCGIEKIKEGVTTLDEVLRVTVLEKSV